jgi:hypothetical protein
LIIIIKATNFNSFRASPARVGALFTLISGAIRNFQRPASVGRSNRRVFDDSYQSVGSASAVEEEREREGGARTGTWRSASSGARGARDRGWRGLGELVADSTSGRGHRQHRARPRPRARRHGPGGEG